MSAWWRLIWLFLLCSPVAQAIDCNSVFPAPIQSFSSSGALYMQSGAMVTNYSAQDVCFAKLNGSNEMNSLACGSGKCVITGIASKQQTRPTFLTSSDTASYAVPVWNQPSSIVLGENRAYGQANASSPSRWDIGSLTINGGGSVSVSDNYSTYVIHGLTLYGGGTLTLTAGKTYIIDGNLRKVRTSP